jgi:hypothetical protein
MKKTCNNCGNMIRVTELGSVCQFGRCNDYEMWEPSEPTMGPIADTGNRTEFSTGAVRDMHEGKGRCDLLPPLAILRLSKHFENGAIKYGDRNWEKGIPCSSFLDSAIRHIMKYSAGMVDEDHLIAAIWNLMCLAETEEKRPEMMDIPSRVMDVR